MSVTFTAYDLYMFVLLIGGVCILYKLFNKVFFPWLVDKCTTDIELNPKWIMKKLQTNYYGFHDLDIVTTHSAFGLLPRFRLEKKTNKLQLLIDEDTSTKDIEDIARLALAGKIKIKYGVWYPEKSLQWLSILNYLLDGGDIKTEAVKWEESQKDE